MKAFDNEIGGRIFHRPCWRVRRTSARRAWVVIGPPNVRLQSWPVRRTIEAISPMRKGYFLYIDLWSCIDCRNKPRGASMIVKPRCSSCRGTGCRGLARPCRLLQCEKSVDAKTRRERRRKVSLTRSSRAWSNGQAASSLSIGANDGRIRPDRFGPRGPFPRCSRHLPALEELFGWVRHDEGR